MDTKCWNIIRYLYMEGPHLENSYIHISVYHLYIGYINTINYEVRVYFVQAFAQDLSSLPLWQVRLRNDRWDWGNLLQISYVFTKITTFSSNQLWFNNIFTRNDTWESKPVQRPDFVSSIYDSSNIIYINSNFESKHNQKHWIYI